MTKNAIENNKIDIDEIVIEKRDKILTRVFRILLILAILTSFLTKHWLNLFTSIVTISLTYTTQWINRHTPIKIIHEINIIAMLFLFAANYLGEIFDFYYYFWWWDIFLHTLSGAFLGYAGFIIVFMLNGSPNIGVELSPFFISMFAFCFAISLGVIWEMFEFFMDGFFGLNMQKSGLIDTMWDLIVDSGGALFAGVTSYLYLKIGRRTSLIDIVEKFIRKNLEIKE